MDKSEAKILLVEDEPSLRFVVERQLKALGYRVTDVADNGILAVQKALADQYHLIFMDVRLPELDGVSATGRIRDGEKKSGIRTPIVGMTAFSHRDICLEAGMDDFLQKPVMLEQLQHVLNKWLQESQLERASEEACRREPSLIDEVSFERTDEKLKEIQQRIESLRKKVGLQ